MTSDCPHGTPPPTLDDPGSRYADWKAPADDGQTLIWPEPVQILDDARANNRRLTSSDALVQNVPVREVRQRLRAWLGMADPAKLLFVTGHQAELHHPGVWAKNALIDAAAHASGGGGADACHVAVDTDEPKHLRLRWPGGGGGLTDDPRAASASWTALLEPPTPAHLASLSGELARASATWGFDPVAPDFLAALRRLSLETPTLSTALTNALHELDWSLGLRHAALALSPMLGAEPYLAFAYHVLSRADRFAHDYNAALDDYRRAHRIRTPGRPMPNLQAKAEDVEVPFWLDDLTAGTRVRATVRRGSDGFLLRAGDGGELLLRPDADAWAGAADLLAFERRHNLRLAPRALTLTMVLRLLVADQFVHGIGGGRYDQVTDRLIARHFGLEPPRFCVTTATLYFPQAVGRPRACVRCVRQEGHRLRHNVLGPAEKRQLLDAIAAAPRGSVQRSTLFFQMHDRLDAQSAHPLLRAWEQRLRETERHHEEERELFDRELFYAIQPRERLVGLIERYRGAFA